MKKIALILFAAATTFANAQVLTDKVQPQVNVSGEGKVKVTPDEAMITIGVENAGADAAEVKKKNDATVDAVIKYLKNAKIPAQDYQTNRVYLNRNYDYNKKKYNYVASQTIVIHLKDLSKYDSLMMGLVDAGINKIQGVEFKSSKITQYESEARIKAVQAARLKADDYAKALGQKVGKAVVVNDNSQTVYPMAMRNMQYDMAMAESAPQMKETLAIGEIEVQANVSISFALE